MRACQTLAILLAAVVVMAQAPTVSGNRSGDRRASPTGAPIPEPRRCRHLRPRKPGAAIPEHEEAAALFARWPRRFLTSLMLGGARVRVTRLESKDTDDWLHENRVGQRRSIWTCADSPQRYPRRAAVWSHRTVSCKRLSHLSDWAAGIDPEDRGCSVLLASWPFRRRTSHGWE